MSNEEPAAQKGFRSGFVGIVGRPNVGKSTLLNKVIGEKVAIVTDKPQTTRDRIMGVLHFDGGQIVFLDTPGIHRGGRRLNHYMMETALRALKDADILFCMFEPPIKELGYRRADGEVSLDDESNLLLEHLAGTSQPRFLVINKVDVLDERRPGSDSGGRQVLAPLTALIQAGASFDGVFAVSSKTGEGIDALVEAAKARLPEGPAYFPQEMFTDQTDRSFASEVIREKIFEFMSQEVPYSTAVTVDEFDDSEEPVRIRATVHVEKESQKGILVGRGAQMIKKIGSAARKDIEEFLGSPVFLKLNVQVSTGWSQDDRIMRRLEYGV
jgi:GTP-binding protein Era